ncbi:hypothetical protein [Sphingosinicella sp.]|uniref:hypothetical protein n=1 Tax=Sphingosinicella sp. TaxID=1917971 RepID=UPI004037E9C3
MGALRWLGSGFPWRTLFVNLAGGLAIGLLAGWRARAGAKRRDCCSPSACSAASPHSRHSASRPS